MRQKPTFLQILWALTLVGSACSPASAQSPAPTDPSSSPEPAPAPQKSAPSPSQSQPSAASLPAGRAIHDLDASQCFQILTSNNISFESVETEQTEPVAIPIRLTGPIQGITITTQGRSSVHSVMDCRLAVAFAVWAPHLRAAGVVQVEHMSIFRPGARVRGSGRRSGHATALAIDIGRFNMADGRVLEVETTWSDRTRGADPTQHRPGDTDDQALLRTLVSIAAAEDTFQVILTPHFDTAHRNHIHLELRSGVSWSFVR